MARRAPALGAIVVAAFVSGASTPARAAGPPSSGDGAGDATALALFEEGQTLAAAGNYAAACPKFAASLAIVRKIGTLVNLADCYEHAGKSASAWARFNEVVALASRDASAHAAERASYARAHALALEPRLAHLTITAPATRVPQMVVKRDGLVMEPATLGTALPVDAGTHTLEVTAPAKLPVIRAVDVPADGAAITFAIPPLEDAPAPTAAEASTDAQRPADAPSHDPAAGKSGSTQRTAALVVGGVGVAAVAVGAVLGLSAASSWHDAQAFCPSDRCTKQGADLHDSAARDATLSTIAFAVGAVGLAGGIALWVTAPRGAAPGGASAAARVELAPAVGFGGGGLRVRGAF